MASVAARAVMGTKRVAPFPDGLPEPAEGTLLKDAPEFPDSPEQPGCWSSLLSSSQPQEPTEPSACITEVSATDSDVEGSQHGGDDVEPFMDSPDVAPGCWPILLASAGSAAPAQELASLDEDGDASPRGKEKTSFLSRLGREADPELVISAPVIAEEDSASLTSVHPASGGTDEEGLPGGAKAAIVSIVGFMECEKGAASGHDGTGNDADVSSTEEGAAHALSAASYVDAGVQDMEPDACSICLDSFTESDPAIVTECNHEYHFQCVLEWAQRKEECPMCWRPLNLQDPACQELLDACGKERKARAAAIEAAQAYTPSLVYGVQRGQIYSRPHPHASVHRPTPSSRQHGSATSSATRRAATARSRQPGTGSTPEASPSSPMPRTASSLFGGDRTGRRGTHPAAHSTSPLGAVSAPPPGASVVLPNTVSDPMPAAHSPPPPGSTALSWFQRRSSQGRRSGLASISKSQDPAAADVSSTSGASATNQGDLQAEGSMTSSVTASTEPTSSGAPVAVAVGSLPAASQPVCIPGSESPSTATSSRASPLATASPRVPPTTAGAAVAAASSHPSWRLRLGRSFNSEGDIRGDFSLKSLSER